MWNARGETAENVTKEEVLALPNLTLAYIGDAVYELIVREHLVSVLPTTNSTLHRLAAKIVSATGQSGTAERMLPLLTEEEKRVYLRGRNAKLSVSKRSNPAIHCRATGLECLFGYLYLSGETGRLKTLASVIFEEKEAGGDCAEQENRPSLGN